ncbi:hypothetical protein ACFVVX_24545 [Kitasatospora sp. NPDC058170]|uniref:hypothetical protein n=1 Tax=Kitasatospora sp. NPDC058170 TaxID=3346364 RepID=UPI0036D9FF41
MAHTDSAIAGRLVALLGLARNALGHASEAALGADTTVIARELAAVEDALRPLRGEVEKDSATLLAERRDTSVYLREVVSEVHVGCEARQLAELAARVAELARTREANGPLPDAVRLPLQGMSALALAMVAMAGEALAQPEPGVLADLHGGLNEIGHRQRLLYGQLLAGTSSVERTDAVDAALLSVYFERCAGHALSAARHAGLFAGLA